MRRRLMLDGWRRRRGGRRSGLNPWLRPDDFHGRRRGGGAHEILHGERGRWFGNRGQLGLGRRLRFRHRLFGLRLRRGLLLLRLRLGSRLLLRWLGRALAGWANAERYVGLGSLRGLRRRRCDRWRWRLCRSSRRFDSRLTRRRRLGLGSRRLLHRDFDRLLGDLEAPVGRRPPQCKRRQDMQRRRHAGRGRRHVIEPEGCSADGVGHDDPVLGCGGPRR